MNTGNMIQIRVEGQEVTGKVIPKDDHQVEVEILSPFGGHRTGITLPPSSKSSRSRPAAGRMYLMRELLQNLYMECRWDPAG